MSLARSPMLMLSSICEECSAASLWGTEWEDGSMQFQLSNPELCSYQSAATHCITPGVG